MTRVRLIEDCEPPPAMALIQLSRYVRSSFAERLDRPFENALPILVLAVLGPVYMVINVMTPGRTVFVPELPLDRVMPLQPVWALVYGSQPIFSFLPVFVVRQVELRRRVVLAYITVVIASYVSFLMYPTIGPRPPEVIGEGFGAWCVRFVYANDPPYNCFPSLHVGYSFMAAFTTYRVDRKTGIAALMWATLIGLSTVYTKQHYIADAVAGAFLAYLGYVVFLRGFSRDAIPEADRLLAPRRTLIAVAIYVIVLTGFWIAFLMGGGA